MLIKTLIIYNLFMKSLLTFCLIFISTNILAELKIKLDQEIDIQLFSDEHNLSQGSDKASIIMHYSDAKKNDSLDRLLIKIKKEKYKILKIETHEKSLEEIFLDVVGK